MIGLGKMGGNIAERLVRHGYKVVGFDHNPAVSQVATLADLANTPPVRNVSMRMRHLGL